MLLATKVQCRWRKLTSRKLRERVQCWMWMKTLLLQKRKTPGQKIRLLFLGSSRKNLGPLLPLSWRKVRCRTRMVIGKRLKIGQETERFHKNIRVQKMRTRKIQTTRRRKKMLIQTRRKTGVRCIPRGAAKCVRRLLDATVVG